MKTLYDHVASAKPYRVEEIEDLLAMLDADRETLGDSATVSLSWYEFLRLTKTAIRSK